MNNPNCCGGHCRSESGEVRKYPLGEGANLILCFDCWAHENRYRYERMREELQGTGVRDSRAFSGEIAAKWPQHNWFRAEVYTGC